MIFFGSSLFAARILQYLVHTGHQIDAIVTQPPRPKGRSNAPVPTPVAALDLGIPVLTPEKASSPESLEVLRSYNSDLYVVAAYGQILKQDLLDIPPKGVINVHPSLLPKYRGAAPIQRCIMNGDAETGVTIMEVVLKLDAGDIILQEKIPLDPDATFPEIESQLCELSCKLLVEAIQGIDTLPRTPQDEAQVTYADKINPEDCQIHWHRSAREIHNLVRAVAPHAWCTAQIRGKEKRLRILKTKVAEDGLLVVPAKGGSLAILELQLEGKKPTTVKEFLNGIPREEFLLIDS